MSSAYRSAHGKHTITSSTSSFAGTMGDLIKQFRAAGQSRDDFCQQQDVSKVSLAKWLRRFEQGSQKSPATDAFVALRMASKIKEASNSASFCTKVEIKLQNNRGLILREVPLQTQLMGLLNDIEGLAPC